MKFNIINNLRFKVGPTVAVVALAATLGSCSMIYDDLPECAKRPETHATVNFVYDYNVDEVDRFADHIGAVTLYVFDEHGTLVLLQEHTVNEHAINIEGYSMPIELPTGKYTLYASARENKSGYEASMQTSGAKFRRSNGTALRDLFYTLDHNNGLVDHQQMPLEHMWFTREAIPFEMTLAPMPEEGEPQPEDVMLTVTVPLQRVTNNVNVTVTRTLVTRASNDQPISTSDYDVKIVTTNGASDLDLLGQPLQSGIPLTYTPHTSAPVTTESGHNSLENSFSTSRLMHEQNPSERTQLVINAKKSGETFTWDVTSLLAQGRHAYGRDWSEQEYLDRQSAYDIAVDFNETDSNWRYIEVSISILKWTKRIQNVDL